MSRSNHLEASNEAIFLTPEEFERAFVPKLTKVLNAASDFKNTKNADGKEPAYQVDSVSTDGAFATFIDIVPTNSNETSNITKISAKFSDAANLGTKEFSVRVTTKTDDFVINDVPSDAGPVSAFLDQLQELAAARIADDKRATEEAAAGLRRFQIDTALVL